MVKCTGRSCMYRSSGPSGDMKVVGIYGARTERSELWRQNEGHRLGAIRPPASRAKEQAGMGTRCAPNPALPSLQMSN